MAKYTNETLKGMAEIVIRDRNSGGENSLQLILTLARVCSLQPADIMNRMNYYARMDCN